MNKAYSALGRVYEYLIYDCDYEKWSQYLLTKLRQYVKYGKGIDCACGSGIFTRAIKRGGYDVCGVDISDEMLTEAVKNTAKEKLNIEFRKMDMTKLKSLEKVDFITVINDGINYIAPKNLQKMFSAFSKNLKKGGVLIFDFSSEYKLRNIVANNMFGEDSEECSYLWFNTLKEDYINMDIVLFIKDGDKYVKKEENHTQYIYSDKVLLDALKNAGFEISELNEHLGGELKSTSQRIEIIAKKV